MITLRNLKLTEKTFEVFSAIRDRLNESFFSGQLRENVANFKTHDFVQLFKEISAGENNNEKSEKSERIERVEKTEREEKKKVKTRRLNSKEINDLLKALVPEIDSFSVESESCILESLVVPLDFKDTSLNKRELQLRKSVCVKFYMIFNKVVAS